METNLSSRQFGMASFTQNALNGIRNLSLLLNAKHYSTSPPWGSGMAWAQLQLLGNRQQRGS
jgi:hypothetical protein